MESPVCSTISELGVEMSSHLRGFATRVAAMVLSGFLLVSLTIFPQANADRLSALDDVVRVVVSGVRNAEDFKGIWGQLPKSQNVLDEALNATRVAQSRGYRVIFPSVGLAMRDALRNEYAQATTEGAAAFALVGHNENGFFRFADGTGWDLSDIAAWQSGGGPIPVLLSCQSKVFALKYGQVVTVSDDITYGVGLDTAEYISNALPRRGNVPFGQIEDAANRGLAMAVANEKRVDARRMTRKVALVGGGALGLTGTALLVTITYDKTQ
jgi:hypothetical protein